MLDYKVTIEEQGLRDGIQNLSKIFDASLKINLIEKLVDTGINRIQIASFVHPKLVPQMADAELVCEAKKSLRDMVVKSRSAGIMVRAGIQCAFGCRYEGTIRQEHVLDMVKYYMDLGVDEIALADSTGMADPMHLEHLMMSVVELAKGLPVILHLHNTENKGYANLYAALRAGVRIFDTAFGGLGGCPFIKSATGNIATEDTIHMLHQMGCHTGVNLRGVARIAQSVADILGYELQGRMYTLLLNDEIKIV